MGPVQCTPPHLTRPFPLFAFGKGVFPRETRDQLSLFLSGNSDFMVRVAVTEVDY